MISWLTNRIAEQIQTKLADPENAALFRAALNPTNMVNRAQTYSDAESFAEKGYGSNVYVRSVVSQRATMAGSIPWVAYKITDKQKAKAYTKKSFNKNKNIQELVRLKSGSMEEADGSDLQEILDNPNSIQAASEYNTAVFSMKDIAGESFEIGFAADENSKKFYKTYQTYPWAVEVIPGHTFTEPIHGYKIQRFGGGEPLPPHQVLHMKYFNPMDFWRGLSPIQSAIMSVVESNEQQAWGAAVAENRGATDKILHIKNMGDVTADALRQRIKDQRVDDEMAGTPIVIGDTLEGASILDLTMKMIDAESLRRIQLTANQIALAYNMPPEMIGDGSQKTFSNYASAVKQAWHGAIIPMLDDRRDELNRFHHDGLCEGGKLYIDYDVSGVEALQPDMTLLSERVIRQWQSDLITLGTALEMLGHDVKENDPMNDMRYSDMRMASFSMAEIQRDMRLHEAALKDLL